MSDSFEHNETHSRHLIPVIGTAFICIAITLFFIAYGLAEEKNKDSSSTKTEIEDKQKGTGEEKEEVNLKDALKEKTFSKWDVRITYNSASKIWNTPPYNRARGSFSERLSFTYNEVGRISEIIDGVYSLWKENNKNKTYDDFYKEFFSLIDKGTHVNDVVLKLSGKTNNYQITTQGPLSMYYAEALEKNYGYLVAFDYCISKAKKDCLYILEGNTDIAEMATDAIIKEPELLVISKEELNNKKDISDDIKDVVLKIRNGTNFGVYNFYITVAARYMKEAQAMSHSVMLEKTRHKTLDNLQKTINQIDDKTDRLKYIDSLLDAHARSYINGIIMDGVSTEEASKVISILKEHPELLVVKQKTLENNKTISSEEKKEILRFRNTVQYPSIYWLIILRGINR